MHHVADAASGQLLTTALDRPPTPLSPADRLSRLGHDASIAQLDGEDMVDLEPGLHQVTFRSIALAREFVLDPGTF